MEKRVENIHEFYRCHVSCQNYNLIVMFGFCFGTLGVLCWWWGFVHESLKSLLHGPVEVGLYKGFSDYLFV
jgi:hypothetical protein